MSRWRAFVGVVASALTASGCAGCAFFPTDCPQSVSCVTSCGDRAPELLCATSCPAGKIDELTVCRGSTDGGPVDGGLTCAQLLGSAYEPFETRCDGIDNDCNGVVDVSEPRLVGEGPGGAFVATMGMPLVELADGDLLGAFNRGLVRLTPEFLDAGFVVPWSSAGFTGGEFRFARVGSGLVVRSYGLAGTELRWLDANGRPRLLADGGEEYWNTDAGVLGAMAQLSSGDLVAPMQTRVSYYAEALLLLPADGGSEIVRPLPSGMFEFDVVATPGDRFLLIELGAAQTAGFRARAVEFDSTLSRVDAGAWTSTAASNTYAQFLRSPWPTGAHDARFGVSGMPAGQVQQIRIEAPDGGRAWLIPTIAEFNLTDSPRGNAVISARGNAPDQTVPSARLDFGPIVELIPDGGLSHLPFRRWNYIVALTDGGYAATFSAEDRGNSASDFRQIYAVRLCLSADGGSVP